MAGRSYSPHRLYYPSLRVTNPSYPEPVQDRDVKLKTSPEHTHLASADNSRAGCRPPGYTASAPWLEDGDLNYPIPIPPRILSNPYLCNLSRPCEDDWGSKVTPEPPDPPVAGLRLPIIRPLRLLHRPKSASSSMSYNGGYIDIGDAARMSQQRRVSEPSRTQTPQRPIHPSFSSDVSYDGSFVADNEIRTTYSQPSFTGPRHRPPEAPGSRPPSGYQQSMGGYQMARSSASSYGTGGHNAYNVDSPKPGPNRSYSTAQMSISSSYSNRRRPALQLGVHGLSFIEEDSESTFTPAGYSRNNFGMTEAMVHATPSPERSHPRVEPVPGEQRRVVVTRQPQRHPSMSPKAVVGNRNAKGVPYGPDGRRDWSTDLCLFCDHNLGTCCKALWCPCIVYGRNKARIEHLYAEEKVHPTRGGTCSDDCAIHACLTTFCLFGWAIQVPNRASVRRRYNIEGDWIGDCAAALFCSPCELSQESREIELEERSFEDQRIWSKRNTND